MVVIIEVILTIFAIMLAGYVAARTRLIEEDASESQSLFVYYVAAPALVRRGPAIRDICRTVGRGRGCLHCDIGARRFRYC